MSQGHTFSAGRDRNVEWQRSEFSTRLWECNRYDITLQQLLSFNNGSNFGATIDGDGCTIKWMYRDAYPTSVETLVDWTPPASEGQDCYGTDVYPLTSLVVNYPEYFHKYLVVKACVPNDEPVCDSDACQPSGTSEGIPQREVLLWVEDRDCNTGELFLKPFGGSRVDTIPAGTEICPMYTVAPECPEPVDSYRAGYTADENYLQRFYAGYTYTEKSKDQYYEGGITAMQEMEDHRRDIFGGTNLAGSQMTGRLPLQLEQAIMNGIGYRGDTEGYGRMKGLWQFGIPHYCLKTWNYHDVKQIFLDLDNAGSNVDESNYMMIGSNELQMIMDEWGSYRTANDMSSSRSFGYGISQIETSFGSMGFTRHRGRALKSNQVLLLDMSKVAMYIHTDWTEKEIVGGTNLCTQMEIWGLFSFLLACPCHHALITIDDACFKDQCCGPEGCQPSSEAPKFCEPGVVVPEAMGMAAPEFC